MCAACIGVLVCWCVALSCGLAAQIPVPIIEHFLTDIQTHKRYVGFCSLGVHCQLTENKFLQTWKKMRLQPAAATASAGAAPAAAQQPPAPAPHTGVLITRVQPTGPAHGILRPGDVLLALDSHALFCDGTVVFRNRERIGFEWVVSGKFAGQPVRCSVLRDGAVLELAVCVAPHQPLVPVFQYDLIPSYFIFAGRPGAALRCAALSVCLLFAVRSPVCCV
jgi:hypothetical protein